MEPDIAETFFGMETSKDIWDTLAETYSRKGNVAQIYELRRLIEFEIQGDPFYSISLPFEFFGNGLTTSSLTILFVLLMLLILNYILRVNGYLNS